MILDNNFQCLNTENCYSKKKKNYVWQGIFVKYCLNYVVQKMGFKHCFLKSPETCF